MHDHSVLTDNCSRFATLSSTIELNNAILMFKQLTRSVCRRGLWVGVNMCCMLWVTALVPSAAMTIQYMGPITPTWIRAAISRTPRCYPPVGNIVKYSAVFWLVLESSADGMQLNNRGYCCLCFNLTSVTYRDWLDSNKGYPTYVVSSLLSRALQRLSETMFY